MNQKFNPTYYIIVMLLSLPGRSMAQLGKNGGAVWSLTANNFTCTENGLYSVYSQKNGSGSRDFLYHASDKGSTLRPELGQIYLFNPEENTFIDANFGLFENLTLFMGAYKPEKKNLGHHYKPENLNNKISSTGIAHKVYYADYWNFKVNIRNKYFFYGFNWRQMHISSEGISGGGNGAHVDTFVYVNNLPRSNSKPWKAVYGINIGFITNFGKKTTWVNQATLARDLAVYKDNGNYVDGALIHNSDIFINRNYNIGSTLFFGENKGFLVGLNYDVLKGKLVNGTIPYKLTKFSIKFGLFFNAWN